MTTRNGAWENERNRSDNRWDHGPDQEGAQGQSGVVARKADDEPSDQKATNEHGKGRNAPTEHAHVFVSARVGTDGAWTVRWAARQAIERDAQYHAEDRNQQRLDKRP